MKVEVDYKQYMAMLKAFTECAQCKAECYRLQAENEKLKHEVSKSNAWSQRLGDYETEGDSLPFLNFCRN